MADTTLVIMAAGMGSRYGGIKQLEPVGPSGEIIMDYSIYDAIEAGFNKVVFIIRKDLEQDFKEIIGNRIEKIIRVEYVFQELDNLPQGFAKPAERTKPWGTGQAVLICKDAVKEPFAVINADDYYGKEAFKIVYNFLNDKSYKENQYCMAGFILGNTLSENGAVTRGVCKANEAGILVDIVETSGIVPEGDHAAAKNNAGETITIDLQSVVSMNMWGFKPGLFGYLEQGFITFVSNLAENELKKEYLLPTVVGDLVKANKVEVSVLKSNDRWFGVTYKEDKEFVVNSFRALIDKGAYPVKLFA
ncbi:MAG TPA: sugar phosphate nucleotidyltransferase [Mobilitalea sp.]|nr:sugar phosphate nucleotidyltransferase [Mobilitalea sp.]